MLVRRLSERLVTIAFAGFMLTMCATLAHTQATPLDATFSHLRQVDKQLGSSGIVSGGARSLFALARNWERIKPTLASAAEANLVTQATSALAGGEITGPLDFSFTRMAGFTQNESSVAWCGKNVVVGFNDTGSILPSFFSANGQATGLGYSTSSDKGADFTDQGFPSLSSDPTSFLGYDQVFTCTSPSNVYFSSLYNNSTQTAVSVSTSTDGGVTFGPPMIVSSASNGGVIAGSVGHFFDGDWMAANPANPNQLFVTYTDDDYTGERCGAGVFGNSIDLVWSNDGGLTWSSPTVVTEVCQAAPGPIGVGPVVEFSDVAVDPTGTTVDVTWELFGQVVAFPTLPREVDIAKATIPSTLGPLSFGNPVTVSSINYTGMFDFMPPYGEAATVVQFLQGRILTSEHPELAIGKGPNNSGVLYVAWNDGDHQVPDSFSFTRSYQFSDILLSSSTDGGATWSAPVRVNNNFEDGSPEHPFTDQFHPALATDAKGRIGVCYYDRSSDPNNFLIGRTCAVSKNGTNWKNISIESPGGPSVVNQDEFTISLHDWLGDYEALTSDSLNEKRGFIGGYTDTSAGYQNILENKF